MSEAQLSIRSSKARDLAHALSRRTGQPINRLVELALERYDQELRDDKIRYPMDAVWDLAADDRRNIAPGATSNHDEFYDETGLPPSDDLIVIGFPTMEAARSWYASPAYQALIGLRSQGAEGDVFLIQGVDEGHRATDILQ